MFSPKYWSGFKFISSQISRHWHFFKTGLNVWSDAAVGRYYQQEQNFKKLGRSPNKTSYDHDDICTCWTGNKIDLHIIAAFEQMLPYMFAPGHLDYTGCGLYYLRNMQAMPLEIWKQFMKGEHTMHHNPCSSNGVSSDMFIESNYIKARYV